MNLETLCMLQTIRNVYKGVINSQAMASVNVEQHKQYEQLYFPGPSIHYDICWLSTNFQDPLLTHGRIEIHTSSADTGTCGPSLEEVSSWAAQVGCTKLPRIPCIAKLTWSLCEARFSCAYNPANGLLDAFLLERMNGYMRTPQGTPWVVTLSQLENSGDKMALMIELVKEPLAIGHNVLYLFAKRTVQGINPNLGNKRQVPLMIENAGHEEEVATRAEGSRVQAPFDRAKSVSEESIREESEKGKRAPNQRHKSLEEQEGASTSQLPPLSPKIGASSQREDMKSMQSMFGKMDWIWVDWRPN
ncbi:MAG: hypothetical protein Q9175_007208 [Cornicularia normoerica]